MNPNKSLRLRFTKAVVLLSLQDREGRDVPGRLPDGRPVHVRPHHRDHQKQSHQERGDCLNGVGGKKPWSTNLYTVYRLARRRTGQQQAAEIEKKSFLS